MRGEIQQHEVIRALTNVVVLFFSVGIALVTGFVWWLHLWQWPDNLRLISGGAVSLGGVAFVLIRWQYGILPRVEPGSPLVISVAYTVGLILGFIVLAALMMWIVLPPR